MEEHELPPYAAAVAPPSHADCPPWCQTDHGKPGLAGAHFGERYDADLDARHIDGRLHFSPFQAAPEIGPERLSKPHIIITAGDSGNESTAFLAPEDAAVVARIIESLARVPAADHRKIAAALREAAGTLSPESRRRPTDHD